MKKCPDCGGTKFIAAIKRPGLIDLSGDKIKILKESTEEKYLAYEVHHCANKDCKKELTNKDLKSDSKCSKCGKEVDEEYLIDGVCVECRMKEEMPDFEKMDPMQRMMYVYKLNKVNDKKGVAEKANKVEAAGQAKADEKAKKEEEKAKKEAEKSKEKEAEKQKEEVKSDTPTPTANRRRNHTAHTPTEDTKEDKEAGAAADVTSTPGEENATEGGPNDEDLDPPNIDNINVPF